MRKTLSVLIALFVAFLPAAAGAQRGDKVYRVGVLVPGPAAAPNSQAVVKGLTQALAGLGYSPDRDLMIESRFAEGRIDRMPTLIQELVAAKVDVLVTGSYPAARAAKEGAGTVPIVASGTGDPVEIGFAASLSRPGGNLTGISDMASELSVKRLDLLREAVPGIKKAAMLWNADDLGMTTRYRAAAAAAATLGLVVQPLGVREPEDFDTAFAAMIRDKPDGILMVTDILTNLNRKRVFEFAAAQRIPAIYEFDRFPRDGGLMSYGPDDKEVTGRIAGLVDRILKGARPADLPFEQPTRFRFVINKKTADALGLALPAAVIDRADEVIE
jgi:putative tryptophan/tyrosine transport system substrate-binding protein